MPSLVTMIEVPGFGDEEIRAGDADVGGEEFGAQHPARLGEQLLPARQRSRFGGQVAVRLAKILLDVVLRDMDCRRNDVRGGLAAKLDDVFAEVGLDRLHPRRLDRVVEPDLLRDHRLALGDALRPERLAEVDDDPARLLGVLCVMNVAAALVHLALVGFEIEVEMGERMVLDGARAVAQGLELRQPLGRGRAPAGEVARMDERALQARVGQRVMDVLLELRASWRRRSSAGPVCGSPIAGPSAMPARTSATCLALTGEPSR